MRQLEQLVINIPMLKVNAWIAPQNFKNAIFVRNNGTKSKRYPQ